MSPVIGHPAPTRKIYLLCFLCGLLGFGGVAGERLLGPSRDNHFVLQADAWTHGQVEIENWPKGTDDPAVVTTVRKKDGTLVRGRYLSSQPAFRQTDGTLLPLGDIESRVKTQFYNSFPPFPAVVMLPQTLLSGRQANDVLTTVLIASAMLPLLLYLLTLLSREGFSERSLSDNLWLCAALGFGSVFFFSAVQGRVWFTAHVIGVTLSVLYLIASLGARAPFCAGLALSCAVLTRTPMVFLLPFFLLEAFRTTRHERRRLVGVLFRFAVPLAVLGGLAMLFNQARFDSPTEFGHSFLAVRQQAQIEASGLFDWSYLGRNLKVAFGLVPRFLSDYPYLKISGHGLALWLTSPYLLLLLWPKRHPLLARALWLTVALVAVPSLLYQNTGWVQFGYRFSLDYMALLIMLVALSTQRLSWPYKALIVWSIAVNAFGAVTFNRMLEFYDFTTYASV